MNAYEIAGQVLDLLKQQTRVNGEPIIIIALNGKIQLWRKTTLPPGATLIKQLNRIEIEQAVQRFMWQSLCREIAELIRKGVL